MNKAASFTIGKVTGVHGLGGNLKVWSFAESVDTFSPGRRVLLKSGKEKGRYFTILKASVHKKGLLLVLEGVDNRDLAEDLVGITRKGRILYGQAHLAKQSAAEERNQEQVEGVAQKAITDIADMLVLNVDAYQEGDSWRVRAEVVGPRVLKPTEIGAIEGKVAKEIDGEAHLEVWVRTELLVSRDGYAPLEGYTEREQTAGGQSGGPLRPKHRGSHSLCS